MWTLTLVALLCTAFVATAQGFYSAQQRRYDSAALFAIVGASMWFTSGFIAMEMLAKGIW